MSPFANLSKFLRKKKANSDVSLSELPTFRTHFLITNVFPEESGNERKENDFSLMSKMQKVSVVNWLVMCDEIIA